MSGARGLVLLLGAALLGCTSTMDPVVGKLRAIQVAPPIDTAAEAGALVVQHIAEMERSLGRQVAPIKITYVGAASPAHPAPRTYW